MPFSRSGVNDINGLFKKMSELKSRALYLVKAHQFDTAWQANDLYDAEGFHGDISSIGFRSFRHAHHCTGWKEADIPVTPESQGKFHDPRNPDADADGYVHYAIPSQTIHRPANRKCRTLGPNEGIPVTMNLQWNQLEMKLTGTPYDCSDHYRNIHSITPRVSRGN